VLGGCFGLAVKLFRLATVERGVLAERAKVNADAGLKVRATY
tara:strand:+ start:345 stop:470 length:126 start_codon:yes stop_codon:yes gene_type:complete